MLIQQTSLGTTLREFGDLEIMSTMGRTVPDLTKICAEYVFHVLPDSVTCLKFFAEF
jgi:hypothetical protein